MCATHKACRPYVSLPKPLSWRTSGMSDSNSTFKFCKTCNSETERYSDGKCKPCTRARNNKYALANKDKKVEYDKIYCAANKEKISVKKAEKYILNKDKARAYYFENKEKIKAKHAKWCAENSDLCRTHLQNRRARKRINGGVLSKGIVDKLFKLQKGKCPCCKEKLMDDYEIDHIIPIALGGMNVDINVQLLHMSCNRQKKAMHPIDFMQQRGFLL